MKIIFTQRSFWNKLFFLVAIFAFVLNVDHSSAQCIYFKKISNGPSATHCVAIANDGTLWAWGFNQFGQVGNNSVDNVGEPLELSSATGWKDVAAGDAHSLAIDAHGNLWGWGANYDGQLGDAQVSGAGYVLAPVKIGTGKWKVISASGAHSLGITTDGRLWVWGYGAFYNSVGEIFISPVQVGTDTDWVTCTTGNLHFIAVKKDSTLWSWGRNGEGEAGDSTTTDNNYTPPREIDSNHVWTAVSAGADHSIALQKNGTVWTWGRNTYGQLGDGTTNDGLKGPKQVGTGKYFSVAASNEFSLAISKDSLRWAWGNDLYGQFGDDRGNSGYIVSYIPELTDSSKHWVKVFANANASYNITDNGTTWASGDDGTEELGVGGVGRSITLIKAGTPNPYFFLAASGGSDTEYQRGYNYYATDCSNLITLIFKTGSNAIHGNTAAKLWIDAFVKADGNGKPYVQRHYEITPLNHDTTFTGTVVLYFTQDEFTAYNSSPKVMDGTYPMLPVDANDAQGYRGNLRINKIMALSNDASGNLNSYNGTQTLIVPTSISYVNGRWQAIVDVTGFGGFFATTGESLLPVTWLNVTAVLNNNSEAQILWKVNEMNTANYTVQKSSDGISFHSVAVINGKGNGVQSYQYTDEQKFSGKIFYRIQQTDKNARVSYSNILVLNNTANGVISLFPNPVNDHVFVKGLSGNIVYTINMYDMQGKIIFTGRLTALQNELFTNKLTNSMYLIKITGENKVPVLLKLIKNK